MIKTLNKICTRCKLKRRINNRMGLCRECHHIIKKEHSDEMRLKIAHYKLLHGCADCGYKGHHAALEFDHIREKKEHNISNMTRWSWKNILKEILKCEVVCANCHGIREWVRKQDRKLKV